MRFLAGFYLLGVVIYVTWGTMTSQGLPGWLFHYLFETFGWAPIELVALGCAAVLGLPALPFLRGQQEMSESEVQASQNKVFAVLIVLPILLGFWGKWKLEDMDSKASSLILEQVDITGGNVELTPEPHLLRLRGKYDLHAAYVITTENYSESHALYVPVVGDKEAPLQFVFTSNSTGNGPRATLPLSPQGYPFAQLGGEERYSEVGEFDVLATPVSLPVPVQETWKQEGYAISPQVFSLEQKLLVDGKIPSQLGMLKPNWAVYFGLGLSAMFLFALVLGRAMGSRR